MESLIIVAAYALPIAWAIVVFVRLGENNRLLRRIAADIAALRKAREEEQDAEPFAADIAALRKAREEERDAER